MSVTYPVLADHLKAIGNALILVGDPSVASGLDVLGLKEGEASVEWNDEYTNLTAPDQSGPAVHESSLMGYNPVVTIPMIIGNDDLYASLSPTGTKGGGHEGPQPVVTTTLVLVPEADFGAGPWSYNGTVWAPAAPKHAIWFWRGYFQRPSASFRVQEGGKRVEEVRFQVMYASATEPDLTLPSGQKQFSIGDPAAQGVTGLLV